jgi:hypothetical protein
MFQKEDIWIKKIRKTNFFNPYEGRIEKLKEPIELMGRVIKYKPVAKLSGKSGAKKGGQYKPIIYNFKIYNISADTKIYTSGVIIEDLFDNKKYFFQNDVMEYAYKIYMRCTFKKWDGKEQEFKVHGDNIDEVRLYLQDPKNKAIILP